MEEQKLQQFLQWLPNKFQEFQDKTMEEIANTLNQMVQSPEGQKTLETLWSTFEQEYVNQDTSSFKFGGKLDYLISLHKKGGKMTKCKCGCEMHTVMEKGGVVKKCSCGCKNKNKVAKKQDGGITGNPKSGIMGGEFMNNFIGKSLNGKSVEGLKKIFEGGGEIQRVSRQDRKKGNYPRTSIIDKGTTAIISEFANTDGTNVSRLIERVGPDYSNKTWQLIQNYGTPKADTVYISPRGNNVGGPARNPVFTETFNRIFGTDVKKIK